MAKRSKPRSDEKVFFNENLVDQFRGKGANSETIDSQFATERSYESESFDDFRSREIIGGVDNRKLVRDTSLDPFRFVCQLIGTRSGGSKSKAGSGFVIGPRTILTAAHNLWLGSKNTDSNKKIDVFKVYPGLDGSRSGSNVQVFSVDKDIPHPAYVKHIDSRFDFAVLQLSKSLPEKFGAMPILGVNPTDLQNHRAMISGYPLCPPNTGCPSRPRAPQGHQYYDVGVLIPHGGLIKYFADTTGGQSGGPVIVITKNQNNQDVWTGVAVHIEGSISTGNKAAPITPVIRQFIAENS